MESLQALGAIAEKRAALRAHHGGEQSVIEADLSADYTRYDVLISTVSSNVQRLGVITARGRTRSSVGLLISLMRERQRLASLLGLRPRLKEATLEDWFTQTDGDEHDDMNNDPSTDGGNNHEQDHDAATGDDGDHGDGE